VKGYQAESVTEIVDLAQMKQIIKNTLQVFVFAFDLD